MDYRETASANREETKTQNATLYASSLGEREGAWRKKTLLIRGLDEKIAFRCTYTITAINTSQSLWKLYIWMLTAELLLM